MLSDQFLLDTLPAVVVVGALSGEVKGLTSAAEILWGLERKASAPFEAPSTSATAWSARVCSAALSQRQAFFSSFLPAVLTKTLVESLQEQFARGVLEPSAWGLALLPAPDALPPARPSCCGEEPEGEPVALVDDYGRHLTGTGQGDQQVAARRTEGADSQDLGQVSGGEQGTAQQEGAQHEDDAQRGTPAEIPPSHPASRQQQHLQPQQPQQQRALQPPRRPLPVGVGEWWPHLPGPMTADGEPYFMSDVLQLRTVSRPLAMRPPQQQQSQQQPQQQSQQQPQQWRRPPGGTYQGPLAAAGSSGGSGSGGLLDPELRHLLDSATSLYRFGTGNEGRLTAALHGPVAHDEAATAPGAGGVAVAWPPGAAASTGAGWVTETAPSLGPGPGSGGGTARLVPQGSTLGHMGERTELSDSARALVGHMPRAGRRTVAAVVSAAVRGGAAAAPSSRGGEAAAEGARRRIRPPAQMAQFVEVQVPPAGEGEGLFGSLFSASGGTLGGGGASGTLGMGGAAAGLVPDAFAALMLGLGPAAGSAETGPMAAAAGAAPAEAPAAGVPSAHSMETGPRGLGLGRSGYALARQRAVQDWMRQDGGSGTVGLRIETIAEINESAYLADSGQGDGYSSGSQGMTHRSSQDLARLFGLGSESSSAMPPPHFQPRQELLLEQQQELHQLQGSSRTVARPLPILMPSAAAAATATGGVAAADEPRGGASVAAPAVVEAGSPASSPAAPVPPVTGTATNGAGPTAAAPSTSVPCVPPDTAEAEVEAESVELLVSAELSPFTCHQAPADEPSALFVSPPDVRQQDPPRAAPSQPQSHRSAAGGGGRSAGVSASGPAGVAPSRTSRPIRRLSTRSRLHTLLQAFDPAGQHARPQHARSATSGSGAAVVTVGGRRVSSVGAGVAGGSGGSGRGSPHLSSPLQNAAGSQAGGLGSGGSGGGGSGRGGESDSGTGSRAGLSRPSSGERTTEADCVEEEEEQGNREEPEEEEEDSRLGRWYQVRLRFIAPRKGRTVSEGAYPSPGAAWAAWVGGTAGALTHQPAPMTAPVAGAAGTAGRAGAAGPPRPAGGWSEPVLQLVAEDVDELVRTAEEVEEELCELQQRTRRLETLLEHEHKVLEAVFPRQAIEYMTRVVGAQSSAPPRQPDPASQPAPPSSGRLFAMTRMLGRATASTAADTGIFVGTSSATNTELTGPLSRDNTDPPPRRQQQNQSLMVPFSADSVAAAGGGAAGPCSSGSGLQPPPASGSTPAAPTPAEPPGPSDSRQLRKPLSFRGRAVLAAAAAVTAGNVAATLGDGQLVATAAGAEGPGWAGGEAGALAAMPGSSAAATAAGADGWTQQGGAAYDGSPPEAGAGAGQAARSLQAGLNPSPGVPLATAHRHVTVLFSDICGFTSMCNCLQPMQVMAFLNGLFTRLDSLCDIYGVYKVETIGDCFMVVGGLITVDGEGFKAVRADGSEDELHALKVMSFAKALLREVSNVTMPHNGEPLRMRVGLHSGPVTAGIVGAKMPRFCLFGDTVNTASRMESTCEPGCIHVSAATRQLLQDEQWTATGGVDVKGKGRMETYLWRPPPGFTAAKNSFSASMASSGFSDACGAQLGGSGVSGAAGTRLSPQAATVPSRVARAAVSDGEVVRQQLALMRQAGLAATAAAGRGTPAPPPADATAARREAAPTGGASAVGPKGEPPVGAAGAVSPQV